MYVRYNGMEYDVPSDFFFLTVSLSLAAHFLKPGDELVAAEVDFERNDGFGNSLKLSFQTLKSAARA